MTHLATLNQSVMDGVTAVQAVQPCQYKPQKLQAIRLQPYRASVENSAILLQVLKGWMQLAMAVKEIDFWWQGLLGPQSANHGISCLGEFAKSSKSNSGHDEASKAQQNLQQHPPEQQATATSARDAQLAWQF